MKYSFDNSAQIDATVFQHSHAVPPSADIMDGHYMRLFRSVFVGAALMAWLALASSQGHAASPTAGSYRILYRWPTGFHQQLFGLVPKDAPLCEAAVVAANQTYGHEAFDLSSDQMPANGELQFADWKAVTSPNGLDIATRLLTGNWNVVYPGGLPQGRTELEKLKSAMDGGAVQLQTTSVENYRLEGGVTRFVRLYKRPRDTSFHSFYIGGQLAIAEGDGFDRLLPVRGHESAQDVFTYHGRSYLFGLGQRYNDNSFKPFTPPQPLLNIFEAGPGGGYAPICKVIFVHRKWR